MARAALKQKQARGGRLNGKPCKVRDYTRCSICGRPHAVLKQTRQIPYFFKTACGRPQILQRV